MNIFMILKIDSSDIADGKHADPTRATEKNMLHA